jgi:hypothetical protein
VDTKAKAKGSSIPDVADATEALRLLWAVMRAFQALSENEQSLPVPEEKYHSFLSKLLPQIFEVFLAGTPHPIPFLFFFLFFFSFLLLLIGCH